MVALAGIGIKIMKKKLRQGDLIKAYWRDTFSESGRWEEKEIKRTIIEDIKNIETIGFFVGQFNNLLVIAMSYEKSKGFNPWGFWKGIPLGTIVKIKKLKEIK